jgi:Tol biopolymer transport system component
MAWSGDGRWLACNTWTPEAAIRGILLVPVSGGPSKRVLPEIPRGGNAYAYALSLSPDGRTLAFVSNDNDPEGLGRPFSSIYTIPSGGGPAVLKAEGYCLEPAFSPGGSRLAYSRWVRRGRGNEPSGELWVASVKNGSSFKICENPKVIRSPTWSPDGRMIAYLEGLGSRVLWITAVAPHGTALSRSVRLELPRETHNMIAGWPHADRIGVILSGEQRRAIYTVPSGGGKALQITADSHPYEPRWSPDSARIFFRLSGTEIGWVPAQGGPVQRIPVVFDEKRLEGAAHFIIVLPGGGYDVSPDGKQLAVSALIGPNGTHIWTLPAKGGVPRQLTQGTVDDRFPCWSPDGKSIAFIRSTEDATDIFEVPVADGVVRRLTSPIDRVVRGRPGWSPDGNWIAYFAGDRTIKLLPASGGSPRTVVDIDAPVNQYRFAEIAWAPDSRRLAFSVGNQIRVLRLDDGETTPLETGVAGFYQGLDWSPDGERIAFQRSWGGAPELWMLEDFVRMIGH